MTVNGPYLCVITLHINLIQISQLTHVIPELVGGSYHIAHYDTVMHLER